MGDDGFCTALDSCGVVVDMDIERLRVDASAARMALDRLLKGKSANELGLFLDGARHFCDDRGRLLLLVSPSLPLAPTTGAAGAGAGAGDNGSYASNGAQESVCKLLLGIKEIQATVIELLLERLLEMVCEDSEPQTQHIARLILQQFRWIDNLDDCRGLVSSLFERYTSFPEQLQKEVVSMLPDMIDDSAQAIVVQELLDKRRDPTLATTVYDTLTNLSLSSAVIEQVVSEVIADLGSTPVDDLPVILRFLMHTVAQPTTDTAAMLADAVRAIRTELDFETLRSASSTTVASSSSSSSSSSYLAARGSGLVTDSVLLVLGMLIASTAAAAAAAAADADENGQ